MKEVVELIKNEESVYFVGRGLDYLLAMEASLKLKEITYIHSEALPAGELKHGSLALISEGCVVFAILTQSDLIEKTFAGVPADTKGFLNINPCLFKRVLLEINGRKLYCYCKISN